MACFHWSDEILVRNKLFSDFFVVFEVLCYDGEAAPIIDFDCSNERVQPILVEKWLVAVVLEDPGNGFCVSGYNG